jgi:hypothetical protein
MSPAGLGEPQQRTKQAFENSQTTCLANLPGSFPHQVVASIAPYLHPESRRHPLRAYVIQIIGSPCATVISTLSGRASYEIYAACNKDPNRWGIPRAIKAPSRYSMCLMALSNGAILSPEPGSKGRCCQSIRFNGHL